MLIQDILTPEQKQAMLTEMQEMIRQLDHTTDTGQRQAETLVLLAGILMNNRPLVFLVEPFHTNGQPTSWPLKAEDHSRHRMERFIRQLESLK